MDLSLITIIALVLLVLGLPLAARRNETCEVIGHGFDVVATPFCTGARACLQSALAFRPVALRALPAQAYPGPNGQRPETTWLWEQLGAILSVAALIVFAVVDWQLLTITVSAVFHAAAGGPLPHVGQLVGLSVVVALAYTTYEILNLCQVTPIKRPWCFFSSRIRRALIVLGIACLASIIIASVAIAVYRVLQINAQHQTIVLAARDPTHLYIVTPPEPITSILLFAFVALLWLALGIDAAGAGLGTLPLLGAATALGKLLLLGLLFTGFLLGACVVFVLRFVCKAVTGLITIWLATDRMLWNWWCSFVVARRLHCEPIDPFRPLPEVGRELVTRLFPTTLAEHSVQHTIEKETIMKRAVSRTMTLMGAGRLAITLLDDLRHAADQLGATPQILAMGRIATTSPLGLQRTTLDHDGVIDVSPQPADRNAIDRDPQSQAHAQAHGMLDNAVQAMLQSNLVHGVTIWIQSLEAHCELAAELLQELSGRQPEQTVLAITAIPGPDRQDSRLLEGVKVYTGLHATGIGVMTVIFDEYSPFAKEVSPEKQLNFAGCLVASLIRAPRDWEQNRTLVDIARAMGRISQSGFVGLSFASECTAAGKQVVVYSSLRRFLRLPARGRGDLEDMLRQTKKAVTRAMDDPTSRAIDEPINTGKPCYVVITSPLKPTDSRWAEFISAVSAWLAKTYPQAIPIYASGPGTPDPRQTGNYWIQVGVLYPLPAMPRPIQDIARRKGLALEVEVGENANGKAEHGDAELVRSAPSVR